MKQKNSSVIVSSSSFSDYRDLHVPFWSLVQTWITARENYVSICSQIHYFNCFSGIIASTWIFGLCKGNGKWVLVYFSMTSFIILYVLLVISQTLKVPTVLNQGSYSLGYLYYVIFYSGYRSQKFLASKFFSPCWILFIFQLSYVLN